MDSIRNSMNKIIEKCDVCINGSVVSKELLIKTFSSFVSSTIEDKQHNVGIVLHTGSVCFDAILLSFAAISNVLYNETNATDIVLSLQADDLVLCYDGNTGNSKPLKWIFKGFVNSVGDTPLMTPGKYIVLESDKNGRKYLPESRWTKIVPYFGSSKSMDGRGLRRESKKRYDFFRSVLGMEDAEIPRTVDTSTVIVMSREEANELVGSISFRFDDTDIKLTDLVPVSYYTESNREYQYGVNLSKNEPVIKITGKVSVARKLLLKKGGNRHIGLVVCGEDLYHHSESELPELLDRKSIQYVYLCMHLDSEALPSSVETKLSEIECKRLVREIFCPQFNVFPSASFEADLKKIVFHRLLDEQAGILDFLDEQLTAAVNGAAGTGKTMIAVEKARRHAAAGERVLFLCFNAQLKDFLEENYARDLVSYYTIAGFACKICNTVKPNYDELREKLEDYYISDSFPYKHVIIDEGQDFGIEAIEETDIIQLIHDIIVGLDQGGTFYVFYDRLQLIQAKEMPKFIGDLDCRLTLYRNCRNTENIAVTSLRPITERKPKVFEGTVKGAPARIHFCDSVQNERERIDSIIDNLAADGYRDVVLLTCKTEATSILSDSVNNGRYRNKYLFTTCRKFKGLEADVVILLDVDKATFEQENVLIFYVGTSRARIKLEITAILSDDDCKEILTSVLNYQGKIRRAKKDFAGALNAIGCLET